MPQYPSSLEFAARMEKRRRLLAQGTAVEPTDPARLKQKTAQLLAALEADPMTAAAAVPRTAFDFAEELAAVSGRFAPDDVVQLSRTEGDDRLTLLTRLAAACSVESSGTGTRWLLRMERRTQVLQRLLTAGDLQHVLAGSLPDTDAAGLLLRAVLRGELLSPEHMDTDELLALSWVLETLAAVPVDKQNAQQVQRLIARRQFLAEYDVLLEHGFLGREVELQQLHAFLQGPQRLLLLTGLGGAGKSTLLAQFARQVVDGRTAIVAVVDFDKPGVDGDDLTSLEAAIARQVTVQIPEAAAPLRQAQAELEQIPQEYRYSRSAFDASASESSNVERSIILAPLGNLMGSYASGLPLLVIVDTFEEPVQRNLGWRIMEWARGLRWVAPQVKLVISGRLFDSALADTAQGVDTVIQVADFTPDAATHFLRQLGVSQPDAERLANSDVLPRRPLELKLLARLVRDGAAASIAALEDELRKGGPAARELFAGLVYRRVLRRLSVTEEYYRELGVTTELVRTLAYPGLTLRYVTADAVENILALALGLTLSGTQAELALQVLAQHQWLTTEQGGKVWHRRDLRRSVLKPMIAEDPERARKIHSLAVVHYDLSPDFETQAEAYYHRLMLMTEPLDPEFDLEMLRKACPVFQADSADFPPAGAALFDFVRNGSLELERFRLLSPAVRGSAYHRLGENLVNSREFSSAMKLYAGDEPAGNLWERQLLYSVAEWDRLRVSLPVDPQINSLRALGWYILPRAASGPVTESQLRRLLAALQDREPLLTGSGWATPLQWLSVGLALATRGEALPDDVAPNLQRLWPQVEKLASDDPVLQKALLLPEIIAKLYIGWLPLTSSTIPLHPQWLRQGATFFREAQGLMAAIYRSVSGGAPSAQALLREVQALRQVGHHAFAPASLRSELVLRYLESPRPEFRDPARYALLEAFADPASHRELGECFQEAIPIRIEELQSGAFVQAISASPEHALESYVELADRAGVLDQLLLAARKRWPENAKLRDVSAVLQRWKEAVRNAANNYGA